VFGLRYEEAMKIRSKVDRLVHFGILAVFSYATSDEELTVRIIRFEDETGRVRWGRELNGSAAQPLADEIYTLSELAGAAVPVRRLLAPVVASNVFCIGLNYREHARESGMDLPEHPVVFMKPVTSIIGTDEPIVIPACCDPSGEVDYEGELAVVLGRVARDVKEEDALDYVFGYTAANDVSARQWQIQRGGGQWSRGKGFDTFCPLGPVLVTADEIPDPQSLTIKTTLNGEVVQRNTAGDMIFDVRQLIAFISQDTTLLPGTIILTGTPQGVGFARKPPLWLKPGDLVEVEVEKIGRLRSPVAASPTMAEEV